jgi:hypothetical protein
MRLSLKPGATVQLLEHPRGVPQVVTVIAAGPYTVSYRDAASVTRSLKRSVFIKRAYRAAGEKAPARALRSYFRIVPQPMGGQPGFRRK